MKRTQTISTPSKKPRSSAPLYARPKAPIRRQQTKETGYVDLASGTYAFDTTGSIVLLATVPQGVIVNTRIGKKIQWKSLQCRGRVEQGSTAVRNDCALLVVYDKHPRDALPAITDILDSANATSFNNDANSGRFRILKRADFLLNSSAAGVFTDTSAMSADFYLDLKGLSVEYEAAGTGAIGDFSTGALYLVTVGINGAGTSAASATLGFRTRFVDV